MGTVSTVNPLAALAGNGHKLTGSGKVVLQAAEKDCIPTAVFGLVASEVIWDKASKRMNPETNREYLTTGQLAQVVNVGGKEYTVSISVTERKAKTDEFALSETEQASPEFASILTLKGNGILSDYQASKAIKALRARK